MTTELNLSEFKENLLHELEQKNGVFGQKKELIAHFIRAAIYTPPIGGIKPSIRLYLALEPQSSWPSGYYENSTHITFMLTQDFQIVADSYGAIPINKELEEKNNSYYKYCAQKSIHRIYRSFRKQKFTDAKDAADRIMKYFQEAMTAINEYKQTIV